eukprot:jgi/Psemu1/184824/e_gw1.42.44.1
MSKEKTCSKKATTAKHKTAGTGRKTAKGLVRSQQKILNIIAVMMLQMGHTEVSRSLLAMQAKIALKSVNNILTKLKQQGLVTMKSGSVSITLEGIEQAESEGVMSATNREHQQSTMDAFKLKPKQRQLFEELSDGGVKTKKDVAEAIGTTNMKSFNNLLGPLKKLGILQYDRDTLSLTDHMFIIEGRPGK